VSLDAAVAEREPGPSETPDVPGGRRPWPALPAPRTLVLIATVIGLIPFLAILARVVAADQFAIHGDAALIELRVRDVGGADTPLLGSYQRFGWFQPGPLLFYLLAAPYRLFGSDFAGLQVGALLLNAAAFVGTVVTVLRRFGAVPALWAVLLLSVLVNAIGPERLSDPWEPRVTALSYVLLLVLTATVASGAAWAMPFAVGVGTFLTQAQTTLAPSAVILLLLGALALLWNLRRAHPGDGPVAILRVVRRPLVATAVVVAVLWLPPLLHEVSGRTSNIAPMLSFAGESQETLGFRAALSAMAFQFDHRAGWITGEVPIVFARGMVDLALAPVIPFSLLALALATTLAAVRRDRSAALGGIVFAAFGIGVLALSRLVGELFDWILYWTWALGMTVWLAAGICAWRSMAPAGRRRLEVGASAVLALGTMATVVASLVGGGPLVENTDRFRSAVLEMADETEAALAGIEGPVLVRSELSADEIIGGTDLGVEPLVLVLARAGHETRVEPHLHAKFGEHRIAEDAVAEVVLVDEDSVPTGPGVEVIGPVDPLTPEETAERDRMAADLRARGLEGATMDDIPEGHMHGILKYQIGRVEQLNGYLPISVVVRPLRP
jgi:hypothetical protein